MKQKYKIENTSVRRTYTLLSKTLFQLLTKMPFEKISLTELCNTSMVPRSTFYHYFDDKFDLLRYCLKTTFEDAGLNEEVVFFRNKDSIRAFLLAIIRYADDNKKLYQQIYSVNQDGILPHLTRTCLMDLVTETFQKEQDEQNGKLTISRPIFATLLSDFYFSTVKCFLEQANQCTVESYVEHVILFIEKDFL